MQSYSSYEVQRGGTLAPSPNAGLCGMTKVPRNLRSNAARVTSRRASGDQALLFISNIRERFTLVGLDEQEHFQALETSAACGLVGGAIYDALLGQCALKAAVETLYT